MVTKNQSQAICTVLTALALQLERDANECIKNRGDRDPVAAQHFAEGLYYAARKARDLRALWRNPLTGV